MGDVEEVQEQMKADMVTLKDQMASMMEAVTTRLVTTVSTL